MERWDAEFTGTAITVVGASVLFVAALAGTVLGVDVGQYGSTAAATLFAGVALMGFTLRIWRPDSPGDGTAGTLVHGGSGGCIGAAVVLLNPLPSVFGQMALVGALLAGFSGTGMIGMGLYRPRWLPG